MQIVAIVAFAFFLSLLPSVLEEGHVVLTALYVVCSLITFVWLLAAGHSLGEDLSDEDRYVHAQREHPFYSKLKRAVANRTPIDRQYFEKEITRFERGAYHEGGKRIEVLGAQMAHIRELYPYIRFTDEVES